MEQIELLILIAEAILDSDNRTEYRNYLPGISPAPERIHSNSILEHISNLNIEIQREVRINTVEGNLRIDFKINNEWIIELKLLRPLGNNGLSNGANWYSKIIYPFPNGNSALRDLVKLNNINTEFRKMVVLVAHYNQNTLATVNDTLNTYELMSNNFFQIAIQREETTEFQMIHPYMNKMKVIGWEIN